jgi:hypothetical protein
MIEVNYRKAFKKIPSDASSKEEDQSTASETWSSDEENFSVSETDGEKPKIRKDRGRDKDSSRNSSPFVPSLAAFLHVRSRSPSGSEKTDDPESSLSISEEESINTPRSEPASLGEKDLSRLSFDKSKAEKKEEKKAKKEKKKVEKAKEKEERRKRRQDKREKKEKREKQEIDIRDDYSVRKSRSLQELTDFVARANLGLHIQSMTPENVRALGESTPKTVAEQLQLEETQGRSRRASKDSVATESDVEALSFLEDESMHKALSLSQDDWDLIIGGASKTFSS